MWRLSIAAGLLHPFSAGPVVHSAEPQIASMLTSGVIAMHMQLRQVWFPVQPRCAQNKCHLYLVELRSCPVLQLHITKNYMAEKGCFASKIKVPLIMGIWGPKGQGKSFQAELVFKKMG